MFGLLLFKKQTLIRFVGKMFFSFSKTIHFWTNLQLLSVQSLYRNTLSCGFYSVTICGAISNQITEPGITSKRGRIPQMADNYTYTWESLSEKDAATVKRCFGPNGNQERVRFFVFCIDEIWPKSGHCLVLSLSHWVLLPNFVQIGFVKVVTWISLSC